MPTAPGELERFAALFRRLVHDFVAHAETPLDCARRESCARYGRQNC
ncbi:hypothetical protein [Streptomyces doebereineriae]|uniref:Uncharacterized protein n=1 Tax=Streptomyces doebereineriae TaxID=3075528 RepID=A0ABU2VCD8_9ACTN|nr:hypothetical protein [Streptomyces sp. DSM 41640]MDT0483227.1 hypothetical protein [Streptomyces sp. DSM 41640]